METMGLPDDTFSDIKSPLFRTIVTLATEYGNEKCMEETCQFLMSNNENKNVNENEYENQNTNANADVLENSRGVAKSVKEQHSHNKDHWELLRNACLSSNKGNNVSPGWKELLESEIFKKKTPQGNTLLHLAAENGHEQFMEEIVLEAPGLLTAKSLNGDTALHVAAKAGHFSALKNLIESHSRNSKTAEEALENIFDKNNEGNTFFHEALINRHKEQENKVIDFLVSLNHDHFKEVVKRAVLSITTNENKSGVYMAIECGYKDIVHKALTELIPKQENYVPEGKSLLLAAIIKQDKDILKTILTEKPGWVHLTDSEGRIPLHYAASTGYLQGVQYLLKECVCCVMERDINGYLPIHLASYAGQVNVVKELLKSVYCPDTKVILDNDGRNILHLAAQCGKYNVVKYILHASNHQYQKMINEKDNYGNTPLHLASMSWRPNIVHALTWDKRVDLSLVNNKCETALDVFKQSENPPLKQRLTWAALISAGTVRSEERKSLATKVPPKASDKIKPPDAKNMDQYKDRISTLMLVSTLIITATFAIGFALPGSINSDDPHPGTAVLLHRIWFQLFIFCITISMYGAISVTIILIWAQLGDLTLALVALKWASPLLGITLGTLSLAFLAGVHLAIRNLTWLNTCFLVMGFISVCMLLLLYVMLWFPSSSRNLVMRLISYLPFLLLASLVEHDEG